jgi:hypothetical protein
MIGNACRPLSRFLNSIACNVFVECVVLLALKGEVPQKHVGVNKELYYVYQMYICWFHESARY